MKVIKRDGREVEYDRNKIAIAIEYSRNATPQEKSITMIRGQLDDIFIS